jgi:hypothetical protein
MPRSQVSARGARCASWRLAATSLALGCGGAPEAPATGDCPTGTAISAASAEGRALLGLASRYPADTMMAARAEEIHRSQRARRAAAWEVVARVLAPVPIGGSAPVDDPTVPRFRTWYDREDITRVFQRAFAELGPEGRAAQSPFREDALDEAFGWNVRFVHTLDFWPSSRWDQYVDSIFQRPALGGVAGIRRIAVSPDAARHLVASYAEVLRCLDGGTPAAFLDGPAEPSQRLEREPFALPRCASRSFGPYFVASGAVMVARVEGGSAATTTLRVLDGAGSVRCVAPGDRGCTVDGPGALRVTLAPTGAAASGVLEVRHTPPSASTAGCLRGVFPVNAAAVSMEWRRSDFGTPLPVYDTSAAAIARRLATASPTWGPGDSVAVPPGESIYTAFVAGAVFQLTGMHIRTRELDRWVHITLWWSSEPDTDFGADRPEALRRLGGPWDSYKMCVVTDFDEGDPDPDGGFARDAPTLAAALRAVHEGHGGPSWCSNPYIDNAPGLVRSNCIGCHQHAMTGVLPAMTVLDEARYPAAGRRQVRNNFPSDQFWGLSLNDALGAVFAEAVTWWRAAERR